MFIIIYRDAKFLWNKSTFKYRLREVTVEKPLTKTFSFQKLVISGKYIVMFQSGVILSNIFYNMSSLPSIRDEIEHSNI